MEGHLRRQPWKQGIERERSNWEWYGTFAPLLLAQVSAGGTIFVHDKGLTSAGILPELMTKTYKNLGSVKVYVPPLGTHCFKLSRGWNAVRIPWDLRSITISVKEKHNQTSWYHKVCRSSSKSAKCACWGLVYSIGGVYTGETCIAVHLP